MGRGIYLGVEGSGTNMPETGGSIYRKLGFRPGFSLFECIRQKIGLIFCKHDSVLVFLMGQNPKCPTWTNIEDVGPTLYKGNTMFCVCWALSMQHNVPTQYRFNVGPASQPIAGSMQVNRIRRWPNIETELGDCPVFALTAIRVTLSHPKGHYQDNTIHWVNYEIMLGHRLRR